MEKKEVCTLGVARPMSELTMNILIKSVTQKYGGFEWVMNTRHVSS